MTNRSHSSPNSERGYAISAASSWERMAAELETKAQAYRKHAEDLLSGKGFPGNVSTYADEATETTHQGSEHVDGDVMRNVAERIAAIIERDMEVVDVQGSALDQSTQPE